MASTTECDEDPSAPARSQTQGRLLIVLAALLWSTSSVYVKLLTHDTALGLNTPPVSPLMMACARAIFASLVLLPAVRLRDLGLRPVMLVMAACFAIMNYLFVRAISEGTAANAILLQYTAPMWMTVGSVWLLGEAADRRSIFSLLIGSVGIAVIIVGGWHDEQLGIIAIGLASGLAYACVVVCLRVLRGSSAAWLTFLNHAAAALMLLPFMLPETMPTLPQGVLLFLFGSVQMALPYWLMARGLRSVSPQEAGTITLLEPLLNPLWAYLIAGETASAFTFVGGGFIVGALAWRYWPRQQWTMDN